MRTEAVIFEQPGRLSIGEVDLLAPGPGDAVVAIHCSGISAGTEKLLWQGRMPGFPGMGYPLVPGYEAVGEVVAASPGGQHRVGDRVFVPGATCFADVRGLFGAAARTLVVPDARLVRNVMGDARGVLLALAATAHHAVAGGLPDLVVGHGTLGRLIVRLTRALGGAPTVWEADPARRADAHGLSAIDPAADDRRDYLRALDASGDLDIVDALVGRLARGGEIVLAGFYPGRVGFAFAPAFMREARLRIAAEWTPADMGAVLALVEAGRLSLDGLITDRRPAADAATAYPHAFDARDCLKMTLDWIN